MSIGVALITGLINYRSNKATQAQQHELQSTINKFAIKKSKHDARQEYEYKARIRLYEEFDPYLFQFMELCESARRAIARLAE